jgi:hypothetical protein
LQGRTGPSASAPRRPLRTASQNNVVEVGSVGLTEVRLQFDTAALLITTGNELLSTDKIDGNRLTSDCN